MSRRAALLVFASLSLCSGCAPFGDSEGSDLLRGARTVYATIPPYPGATEVSHWEGTAREDENGPVTSGGVNHVLRLPAATTIGDVATFYTRRRSAEGWKLRERLPGLSNHRAGPVLNFRRGRAEVSVNLEGGYAHKLELAVSEARKRPS